MVKRAGVPQRLLFTIFSRKYRGEVSREYDKGFLPEFQKALGSPRDRELISCTRPHRLCGSQAVLAGGDYQGRSRRISECHCNPVKAGIGVDRLDDGFFLGGRVSYPFGGTPNIAREDACAPHFHSRGRGAVSRVATTRSRDALPDLQKRISRALPAERGEALLRL